MKITKNQLRRIIREEKARLLSEASPADMSMHDAADHYEKERIDTNTMDPKTADALQLLQTININLQDLMANARGPMYDDLNEQIALLEDAIHMLGGIAS